MEDQAVATTTGSTHYERTITCATCGKEQTYRKQPGISGRPPGNCKDHRAKVRGTGEAPRSWEPIGEPK